jgi:hypothetical protein
MFDPRERRRGTLSREERATSDPCFDGRSVLKHLAYAWSPCCHSSVKCAVQEMMGWGVDVGLQRKRNRPHQGKHTCKHGDHAKPLWERTPLFRVLDHRSSNFTVPTSTNTDAQDLCHSPIPRIRWILLIVVTWIAIHSAPSPSTTPHLRSSALSLATTLRQPQALRTTSMHAVHRTTKPNTRLGMAVTTTGAASRRIMLPAPTLQLR